MSEGQITIGNYELRNCVASGSSTQIWEVSQPGSPMQLAMKLLLDDALKDANEKSILKHEFKVGKSLEHPCFLRFHEIEVNRDHGFFTMDFYRSPSLKTHITTGLPAIQSSFKKLAESLAQAFFYMHESGWLHRDIKPDNILVNKTGEVRVIDFSLTTRVLGGLGKLFAGKQKAIQGTRTYIAPETILKKPPTQQTDIYSLGVTFFEVLTGQPPFAGDSPNALLKKHLGEDPVGPSIMNANVTKELDRVILQMLEKNPAKRFGSMQELESALRNIRCFEEDPLTLFERKQQEARDSMSQSIDRRLDSRADAERTAKGIAAPAKPQAKRRVSEAVLREEEERKRKEEAKKQQAAMPAGMQYPPGMPMPGMPMQPGMMYPGMMYPGMPMPPGMGYPGMPMPGMPMPPGAAYPGMPGQGMPGQPVPQTPAQNIPSGQIPAPGQPSTAAQIPVLGQPQVPVTPPPQVVNAPPPAGQVPARDPEEVTTEDLINLMSELEIE